VKRADGEAIFDLIRFLLPFLATIKSSMYFPFLVTWVRQTLSMSPYDRAMRLKNMFVNRNGAAGHAREVDLEFEYLVCGVKRMAKLLPNPTKEQLSQVVKDYPLFEQLREEVDVTFKPSKQSTSRSVRKNEVAIKQLSDSLVRDVSDMDLLDATVKNLPLHFVFDRFRKKIAKLAAPTSLKKSTNLEHDAIGEDLNSDEFENAFLNNDD
jgi:hypothetical protein